MKILHIIGARPHFIKLSPLYNELKDHEQIILHTGQHYDYEMSKVFFEEFKLPLPDLNLEVGSGTHGYQTTEVIRRIEQPLRIYNPDAVLVYGDTNTSFGGGYISRLLKYPMGHVEAGTRTGSDSIEETNRTVLDHISQQNYAPTLISLKHLRNEGLKNGAFTGDLMYDTFLQKEKRIMEEERFLDEDYIVLTLHREENTNRDKLLKLLDILRDIDTKIVFPIHPRTKRIIIEENLMKEFTKLKNLHIIDPVGYILFMSLLYNAELAITDSGGVQKESYFVDIPCIVLGKGTGWEELVDKYIFLCDFNKEKILPIIDKPCTKKVNKGILGYGDSAKKIKMCIEELV